ncbi:uncharacterized protein LOC124381190 [Silurus meridionalis]|uniref:uncharacterized protein LOC124381190 n=1 Tax=Silurus meridionalis TaxID=175797 RepID=UPI001EEC38A6|nr:uncharacterized protein LOC124381190 [Silurus meridionalis]
MAGFFQQLRLLLWKNGLGVIRQPGWSLVLLIWPVVIFIILAITRSQFPPVLKDTCYVAPRNLPSAGFFPFLQTLMCNTDSTCSNKSYLQDSKSLRQRRDLRSQSSPLLPLFHHGLPHLPKLEKFGLVHRIMKRDTSNQTQIPQQWDTWLNSSVQASQNLTMSILDAINNTLMLDQDVLSSILYSTDTLKTIFCDISMSKLSTSNQLTSALTHFCTSNDTALEVSLSSLNQLMAQMVLQDPIKFIEAMEISVETMDQLQTQSPVWDFLLGLPDIFLKSTNQGRIMVLAEKLKGMKQALNSIQGSFQQANSSMDTLYPVIDESIELLNYLHTWEGRNVNISLAAVLVPYNMSEISSEMVTIIQDLQVPLDKVLVLFNLSAFSEFVCTSRLFCDSSQLDAIYGLIDHEKVALQVLLAWSQSATSPQDLAFTKDFLGKFFGGVFLGESNTGSENSAGQPETMQEQIFLSIGNAVMGVLSGTPSWDYLQNLLMGTHSSMQFATAVLDTQQDYIQPLLQNRYNLQSTIVSLIQNEIAEGNETRWLDVGQKLNHLSSVFNGTLVYSVTPTMILAEWHRLHSTALQYSDSFKDIVALIQDTLFNQIPHNSTIDWSEILLNSSFEEFAMIGSVLQNSSQWSTMEPYFQVAYWVMTFEPNITGPPNCTFTPNDTICNTVFTWEEFVPMVGSLIQEIKKNPAALLRLIQGAAFLLKGIITDTYMSHLPEFLNNTGHFFADGSPNNISSNLTDLVNQNLQLLLNNPPTNELDEDTLLAMLGDTLKTFGLGELGILWSGSLNYSQPKSVVMNILHMMSSASDQMFHNKGQFAIICNILQELEERLAPKQQIQLEGVFNHTNALFEDLALCAASGQDCLSDVSHLFQMLSLLEELKAVGDVANFTMMPIKSNMTFSVALHLFYLLLPRNISEYSAYSMDNVSEIINLLEQLYNSHNISLQNILEELQALNFTVSDLEQFEHLLENVSLPLLLSKLMELVNISYCMNPVSYINSTVPKCTMQVIEGLTGFLQAIPMLEDFHEDASSFLNMALDHVMELSNISSLQSDLPVSGVLNSTHVNSVIMYILNMLRPESIQMFQTKGHFAVLCKILQELGERMAPEQQIQLEGVFNHSNALFEDLALCTASGQDCLSDVSHLFRCFLCLKS